MVTRRPGGSSVPRNMSQQQVRMGWWWWCAEPLAEDISCQEIVLGLPSTEHRSAEQGIDGERLVIAGLKRPSQVALPTEGFRTIGHRTVGPCCLCCEWPASVGDVCGRNIVGPVDLDHLLAVGCKRVVGSGVHHHQPSEKFNHFQNLLGLCFASGGVLKKTSGLVRLHFCLW
jgi:hypothetical protein